MAWGPDTWAAIASAVAAAASCVVAFVVARKQSDWQAQAEQGRRDRDDQRRVALVIEELNQALGHVHLRAIFDDLDLEPGTAEQVQSVVAYPSGILASLKKGEEALPFFRDSTGVSIGRALHGVSLLQDAAQGCIERLRNPCTDAERDAALRRFNRVRDIAVDRIEAAGLDLRANGAQPEVWHERPGDVGG